MTEPRYQTDSTLAPCPICGAPAQRGTADMWSEEHDAMVAAYWITCANWQCLCAPSCGTPAEAEAAWNALCEAWRLRAAVARLEMSARLIVEPILDSLSWQAESEITRYYSARGESAAAAIIALAERVRDEKVNRNA